MFTNVDVCGVPRGRCGREQCECDGFSRMYVETHVSASGMIHSGWCSYCGHPPVNHSRFERNICGRQEILSLSWQGARPPPLSLPARPWNSLTEGAHSTADDVIVVEPEEVMCETSAPDNEKTEVAIQPAEKEPSDQHSGLKRKRSDEDTSTSNGSSSQSKDLLQKVETLEHENSELKKLLLEQNKLTTTVATLVEVVKKLERRLSEPKSGHEDNSSSQKSPQESVRRSGRNGRKNQQCDQQCDATTDGSVSIGEGVTLTKEELEKLWQTPNLNATKFVRSLCLTVFTPAGLEGKCLKRKGGNRNKEILDPVRLKTIIDAALALA
ncbi:uncharacterized protein LOC119163860 isoform X2 [Rhipicephalus microplus]|uniref:uncharacterized protein LOC119163860 isoform X2 n=1 Tax=Rhipicephalus microplus TaxID=6941 RepID=UPI003F6AF9FC